MSKSSGDSIEPSTKLGDLLTIAHGCRLEIAGKRLLLEIYLCAGFISRFLLQEGVLYRIISIHSRHREARRCSKSPRRDSPKNTAFNPWPLLSQTRLLVRFSPAWQEIACTRSPQLPYGPFFASMSRAYHASLPLPLDSMLAAAHTIAL